MLIIFRDSNQNRQAILWNDVFYSSNSSSKVEEVALAFASDGGVCNFNPPQGWLLIAPARHNSNKFDSALAYS